MVSLLEIEDQSTYSIILLEGSDPAIAGGGGSFIGKNLNVEHVWEHFENNLLSFDKGYT